MGAAGMNQMRRSIFGRPLCTPVGARTNTIPAVMMTFTIGEYCNWYTREHRSPIFSDGTNVYARGDAAVDLVALDAETGELTWDGLSDSLETYRMDMGSAGEKYLARGSKLTRINADGSTAWEVTATTFPFAASFSEVKVLSSGNLVTASLARCEIRNPATGLVDPTTGTGGTALNQAVALGSNRFAAVGAFVPFGVGDYYNVVILDGADITAVGLGGSIVAGRQIGDGGSFRAAGSGGNVIAVCSNGVYCLDPGSLATIWSDTTLGYSGDAHVIDISAAGGKVWLCGTRCNTWTGSAGAYATVWRLDAATGVIDYTWDAGAELPTVSSGITISKIVASAADQFHVSPGGGGANKYWPFRA